MLLLIVKKYIGPISKNGFWSEIKAAVRNEPEEYIGYFED